MTIVTANQNYVYTAEKDKKVYVTGTVVIVPGGGEAPVLETCEDPGIRQDRSHNCYGRRYVPHFLYFAGASSGSADWEFGIPSNVKLEVNA